MRQKTTTALWIPVLVMAIGTASTARGEETGESPAVTTMRVPQGGIQPQVVVDHDGGIHMTYFKGDAHAHETAIARPWKLATRAESDAGR